MPPRRRPGPAPTLALLGLAGALGLLAAGQPWATGVLRHPIGGLFVTVHVRRTGHDVAGIGTAAALLAVACVVAALAVPPRARLVVGALVAAAGGLAAAAALGPGLAPAAGLHRSVWPLVGALAGLLQLGAGLGLALAGPGWRRMSRRYERARGRPGGTSSAAQAPPGDPVSLWDAQDRGEDPT